MQLRHATSTVCKSKYLGKPKYVQVVVDQCTIEKALVHHYDLSLDHV
jgi:hypothetical protein